MGLDGCPISVKSDDLTDEFFLPNVHHLIDLRASHALGYDYRTRNSPYLTHIVSPLLTMLFLHQLIRLTFPVLIQCCFDFPSTMHYCQYFNILATFYDSINDPVISINDFPKSMIFKLWHDATTTRHRLKFQGRSDKGFYESGSVCFGISCNIVMNCL